MSDTRYDVVIVGSGPGGGTVAWKLAKTGKRILLIERGDYLRRGRENWDSKAVFVDGLYQAAETWTSASGEFISSGPALLRRRQQQVLRRGIVPPSGARLLRRGAP